jgi:hypothetical protein
MKVPVNVAEATGQARNFLYALWVCHGYNPCDSVFWGLMKSAPPSDKSWNIVKNDIVKALGNEVNIPKEFA